MSRSIGELGESIEAGLISRSQASLEWNISKSVGVCSMRTCGDSNLAGFLFAAPGISEGASGDMPLKVAVKFFSLSLEAKVKSCLSCVNALNRCSGSS